MTTLGWINHVDAATVSATSAATPAANVQHAHVARRWHTAPGVTSAALVFDLGAPRACGLLGIAGSNLSAGATLRLRASDTDTTAQTNLLHDSGTVGAGVVAGYGTGVRVFGPATARYWRLDLTDASLSDVRVGRVFLGPRWQPAAGLSWDWGVGWDDLSRVVESHGGQIYVDEVPRRRLLMLRLEWLSVDEAMTGVLEMRRACGVTRGVLVIPETGSIHVARQALWGRMTERNEPIFNRHSNIWAQKFQFEELL